jgi:iron complex transport system ATP-binding protein
MTALELERVTVTVGRRTLLDGIDLRIESGDTVALIGPNGSGKTTLLRSVLGLQKLSRGVVRFDGRSLESLSAKERANAVAFLAQHSNAEEAISVLEYVAAGRYRFDEARSVSEAAALAALKRVGAEELADQLIPTLSGGERQRISLAALLAQAALIQLLDEPANHLDPARQARSYALLGEMQQELCTMVIVTHDINLLGYLRWPERVRVVGLAEGKLAFDLGYGDERLVSALSELYRVPMQCVKSAGHRFILPELDAAKGAFE